MSLTSLATRFASAYTQPITPRRPDDLGALGGEPVPNPAEASNAVTDDLKSLTDFVPTEVLTLYIAGVAAIQNYKFPGSDNVTPTKMLEVIFWISVALCAVWVIAGMFITAKSRMPARAYIWPICVGIIAFVVYAIAIPGSWLALKITYGTLFASIGVLIVTPVLLLLTKLYVKLFPDLQTNG